VLASVQRWLATLARDRDRRAHALVALALLVAAFARVGTAGWGMPFRYHVDELGFVMWVAAHAEWNGFVHGSFEPTVTTYGPLVYELAIATKWLVSGTGDAASAAHQVSDGWQYLTLLDDPARTPLTMIGWIHTMRVVSAWIGVATVLVLARATKRLAGPEAAAIVAWLAALAPGLVQVSHFYTPDGLLLLFEVMVLDAASLLLDRPSAARASYAGLSIGLVLATKMTGGLVALLVPWAMYARRERLGEVSGAGALLHACFARPTWIAVLVSILTYAVLCPWAVMRGPAYFTGGGGPTSGAYMLRSLYEDDFGFYDWRFAYLDQPRGLTFFTSLLPYVIGGPAVIAGLAGLVLAERRTRLLAWGLLAPTAALVLGWTVLTIRYALPLAPPLLLAASALLAQLATSPRPLRGRLSVAVLGRVALGVVLALCLARGLAWTLMFTADDPRTLASRWIASHAHDGDIVVAESEHHYTAPLGGADEPTGALPYPMPRIEIRRLFSGGELGRAIPVHSTRLLRGARYLVLSDWMLRRALSEPGTLRSSDHAVLYAALLDGRHGYTEVARFDREPRLGPLVWHEDHDEQLAICFDHCPVRILERTGEYVSPFASPEGPASESE
jgi:hypothetical protein